MATKSVKRQVSDIAKKAKQIQSTFNKTKGSLSASDRAKIGAGLTKATQGVSSLVKSDAVAKATGGRGSTGRDYSKAAVITPEKLQKTEVYVPPTMKADTTDFKSMLDVGNAATVDVTAGLTQKGNQFVYDPSKSAAENDVLEGAANQRATLDYINKLIQPEKQANERAFRDTEKEVGLQKFQKEVGARQSELNAIVANRDAAALSLEGQGRGQTQGFVGGEQARINREAAIQALPVQAQLSAAQGNLEMAQQRLDTLFKVKSADIAANAAYRNTMANAIMDYASDTQKAIIAARAEDRNREDAKATQNLALAQEWAKMAVQTGQSGLISSFTSLDPKSPTFTQDFGKLQAQVNDPMVKLQQEAARANIDQSWASLNIRREELALSKKRLDAELASSGNTYGTVDGKPQNATQALVNSYANRLIEAETVFDTVADQFAEPTAFGGILPSLLQSGERQQYEQAKRNFVNAVLRRESGAVISDQEFKNAEMQYFPQAGDKPEVVLQKEQNRNTVINNFYREANVPRPVFAGDIIESGGKKYQVAEDGVTLIEI